MSQLPETPQNIPTESPKKVIELSRDALALRLWLKTEELPDRKFFKIVDEQLDRLAGLDPRDKAKALKEELGRIQIAEVADKAKELWKDGLDVAKKLTPEILTSTLKTTTEKIKTDMWKWGAEVLWAVGEIVNAGNIEWATGGIGKLSKAIDAVSGTVSSAIKWLWETFSSLMVMLGLDKLWASIKGLFGMKSEEKKDDSSQKKIEDWVEKVKSEWEKMASTVLDKDKRNKFLGKISQSFGDKISTTYFGWQKLSDIQMEKIKNIFTTSLSPESLEKIAKRYEKEGLALNIWEITDAIWEVGWAYPAKVMWELSWSGIIPMWAISQHVVINPAKNLIALTFDWLGFPMTQVSFSEWGNMLDEKAKNGDTHALDMARIQLYGVNSVLWRTMGSVLGSAVSTGIMFTDTTTKTDGIKMGKMTVLKEYDALALEFQKIESTLSRGTMNEKSIWVFTQMMEGIKGIRANSLLLDIVAKNTVNGVMDASNIINAIAKNPELEIFHSQLTNLKGFADPKMANNFRDAIKNMATGQSSTANWSQNIAREWSKYAGGKDGAMIGYLERIDHIKASQTNLLGNSGLSEKWNRMKLVFQSLKMARTGDTVNLHLETAEDISKFRSFLSVIPGGIRAISEIIPATALVISLGSIAWNAKDTKDHTTWESLMDVFKTALIPAYGTFGIIRSKTVDFGKMIGEGQMPEFSDIALTGVVGWVFMYEVTRVASGFIDMKNGNLMKWLSKLTYMHDIGRGLGQMARWTRNISALAKAPVANPAVTRALTDLATKVPKKGRLAIWAVALLAAGWAYAYISWPENPEDILKNLHKEGWLDIRNNPTPKMKEAFQSKNQTERKDILDELLIMHLETNKNLPKTHYEWESGRYIIISGANFTGQKLIDSLFRSTIQSLGVDIDMKKA